MDAEYNEKLSAQVDGMLRAIASELRKDGGEDQVRDVALMMSKAMQGYTFAVAVAALGVALLTLARTAPCPEAVVVMTAENCINSLASGRARETMN